MLKPGGHDDTPSNSISVLLYTINKQKNNIRAQINFLRYRWLIIVLNTRITILMSCILTDKSVLDKFMFHYRQNKSPFLVKYSLATMWFYLHYCAHHSQRCIWIFKVKVKPTTGKSVYYIVCSTSYPTGKISRNFLYYWNQS